LDAAWLKPREGDEASTASLAGADRIAALRKSPRALPPNFIEITTMQHIALQRLSAET
jgi:hypothetical protein